MGWQRLRDWIFGATLTWFVLMLGETSGFCSWSALHVEVGEGRGSRLEEATLIMDIAGAGGAELEIQRGLERVRVPQGFALKGCI